MSRVVLSLALVVVSWVAAPRAQAQAVLQWLPPGQAEEKIREKRVAGLLFFQGRSGPYQQSLAFQFSQPSIIAFVKKSFVVSRLSLEGDSYGAHQGLADRLNVGKEGTIVIVGQDMAPIAVISQIVNVVDFEQWLRANYVAFKKRLAECDEAKSGIEQIEKWVADPNPSTTRKAALRIATLLGKGEKIEAGQIDRAKELKVQLETIGESKCDDAESLIGEGKLAEARAVLKDVRDNFPKCDCSARASARLKEIGER